MATTRRSKRTKRKTETKRDVSKKNNEKKYKRHHINTAKRTKLSQKSLKHIEKTKNSGNNFERITVDQNNDTKKYDYVILKVNNVEMITIPEYPDIKIKMVKGGKHPYMCQKCDLGFWTKKAYEAHAPVHILRKAKQPTKRFRCDVCAKEFGKLCDIERHTRVHTGEKPCICNICNKRFQQAHNLSKHLLTHLHIKPFICEICNKQFGRHDVLRRHLLTHSVQKPIKCSICEKGFIRQSQLLQHLKKKHPNQPIDQLTEPYIEMSEEEEDGIKNEDEEGEMSKVIL